MIQNTAKGIDLIFDEEISSYKKLEPTKILHTGRIYEHYRASLMFVLREKVMTGFKKDFLESVEIFTRDGFKIASTYRIRENEWHKDASKEIVKRHIKEFLYSKYNINAYLNDELDMLYATKSEILSFKSWLNIENFISVHEK